MAIEFSILRATSVSSCEGEAPGNCAATLMVGRSRSGKFCTFIELKVRTPPTRFTAPTPRTLSMALVTVLSTNQLRASSSIRVAATV